MDLDSQPQPINVERGKRRELRQQGREVQRQITSRLPRVPRPEERRARSRFRWRLHLPARWTRVRQLVINYYRDDGDALATVIAYNALFSLLPLLFMVFTLLSLLVKNDAIDQQMQDWVRAGLPQSAADSVIKIVRSGRDNVGEISLVALVSYLIAGSRLFSAVERALSTISRTQRRSFVERKLASLVMVPLVALLMIVAAAGTTLATIMLALPDRLFASGSPHWFSGTVTFGISLTLSFLFALGLYTIVPAQRPRWRTVWRGSAVAALLFVVLGQLFPLYMRVAGGFSVSGGALALALVLLLWLYLLGQIIVIGAEVNALAAGRGQTPPPDTPV